MPVPARSRSTAPSRSGAARGVPGPASRPATTLSSTPTSPMDRFRMLQITNLHATVGGTPILNGLSLAVNAGEVHAIMGPNGAGKSTLAYVLGGRPGYEVTGG